MADVAILDGISRHWWAVALRGVCSVLFGILAFVWPGITLAALVILYGAYAFADGIFALVAGIRGGLGGMVLVGILGLAAGLITFFYPGLTALALLYVIAFWSILHGVFEVVAAVKLRKEIDNEWLLGLAGLASIGFGVLLFLFPGAGALSVVWLIGAYAVAFGVVLIALGFRLKGRPMRAQRAYA